MVDLVEPEPPAQADAPRRDNEEDGLGCLRTGRGNLPLDAVDVQAAVTGLASSITLSQGFHNPYDEPLEATYIFPLPPRAAVTALRMEADGRVVEAELKERGEARADYDTAISQGKRASIAEEERPGVFTMRVGNILPGERVTVRLTLAGELPYEDGAATFRFPLVVAPRYIPGAPLTGGQVGDGVAADTDAVPDASRISPPVLLPGFPNPVRLSVAVDVDPAGLRLAAVDASLHSVITERRTDGLRVRLEPGDRADRDFLLRLTFDADEAVSTALSVRPDEPTADGVAADGGETAAAGQTAGGTFALTILPPAGTTRARDRDVVVVLDRSGSMGGWKMIAARRAAGRIVDTLRGGDRFAVLAFDHQVETPPALPRGLAPASDRARFRAVEFLATLEARGGTDMLEPLRQAADLLGPRAETPERDRVIVLVTDGQVGNEDQLLRELATGLAGARVHTVGIDRAVNESFLRRLSGPAGRCELVESEDRLDDAMRNIHHRIDAPVVTGLRLLPAGPADLAVDADSLTPTPLPDLFAGAPVVITGRFTGPPAGTVTVVGQTSGDAGSPWRTAVGATASGNPALPALWARARIRDLEDQYVVGRGGRRGNEELERRVVETSLRFGVLSRFTAFVAVDHRVVNEGGAPRRVTQPVDLPSGWDHEEERARGGPALPLAGGARLASFAAPASPPVTMPPPMAPPPVAPAPYQPAPVWAGPGGSRGWDDLDVPDFLKTGPWAGPAPAQQPAAPPAPGRTRGRAKAKGPRVATLAELAATELAALRAGSGHSTETRAAALAALAGRIRAALPAWRRDGEPEAACVALEKLRDQLATAPSGEAEVTRLWERALAVLEAIRDGRAERLPEAGPEADAPARRSRQPFWKR
ncbi:VIT domain-containing protein [Pseudofrankia asymbiotica]